MVAGRIVGVRVYFHVIGSTICFWIPEVITGRIVSVFSQATGSPEFLKSHQSESPLVPMSSCEFHESEEGSFRVCEETHWVFFAIPSSYVVYSMETVSFPVPFADMVVPEEKTPQGVA